MMLVLSRKLNESIQLSDNIFIKVVAIAGGRVKIGIDAPDYITIERKSVDDEQQRKQTDNK